MVGVGGIDIHIFTLPVGFKKKEYNCIFIVHFCGPDRAIGERSVVCVCVSEL